MTDAKQIKNNVFEEIVGQEWLKGVLREGVTEIIFTKKDGTERLLLATLAESEIPAEFVPKGESKTKSVEALAVFDVESQGWRSFRWDSVKSIAFPAGK
jgi:hypothetical protein